MTLHQHPSSLLIGARAEGRAAGREMIDEILGRLTVDSSLEEICAAHSEISISMMMAIIASDSTKIPPERVAFASGLAAAAEAQLAVHFGSDRKLGPREQRLETLKRFKRFVFGIAVPEDIHVLRSCVAAFLAGRGRISLDAAFSLQPTRGGIQIFRAAAIQRRNVALRELVRFYPGPTQSAIAREIQLAITKYLRTDQQHHSVPIGGAQQHLFAVAASTNRLPSLRTIRRVIGSQPRNRDLNGQVDLAM